jgi:hypothetical protein
MGSSAVPAGTPKHQLQSVLLTVFTLLWLHPPHLHVAAGIQRGQLVAVSRPRKA